jgi:hypothetical protein
MDMDDFLSFPLQWIDIKDCVWPDHDLNKDHLGEPERRRDNDNDPIFVEQLVTGHWFIHDGRHRLLRARARGEHQIQAYACTKTAQRAAWARREQAWKESTELIGS